MKLCLEELLVVVVVVLNQNVTVLPSLDHNCKTNKQTKNPKSLGMTQCVILSKVALAGLI